MTGKEKLHYSLKSVFSTASLHGAAAVLMSVSMGSAPASVLYLSAVLLGIYNKYRSLQESAESAAPPDGGGKGVLSRFRVDPSITAKILMFAAACNFAAAGYDAACGPEQDQLANILRMGGWAFGFLGDNALRRLDSVNFREGQALNVKRNSRLRETFNVLTANPTVFYNGASMGFTLAVLSKGATALEQHLGALAVGLVSFGILYAVNQSRRAAQGKIGMEKINDGVMNYCSSAGKGIQSIVSILTGYYWLAAAQAIFTGSNIKLIYETREALDEKKPKGHDGPQA